MNNSYTKLFAKILDSTIWLEDDKTRIVWITLLAMSGEDGRVDAPIPAIAARAHVDMESCTRAMEKFQQPDPDSRTKDHEGRRIQKQDEGWLVLNHLKYRQMMSLEYRREYKRIKAKEYRDRLRALDKDKTIRQLVKERVDAEEALERTT